MRDASWDIMVVPDKCRAQQSFQHYRAETREGVSAAHPNTARIAGRTYMFHTTDK